MEHVLHKESVKSRYIVLLPGYVWCEHGVAEACVGLPPAPPAPVRYARRRSLAYFGKAADAVVDGNRLTSDYRHTSLSMLRSHGAEVALRSVKSVTARDTSLTVELDGGRCRAVDPHPDAAPAFDANV